MKLLKINSKYVLQELFKFISPTLKYHIISKNQILNDKLDILYSKKRNFFKNKIKNYKFNNIIEYNTQFKKDFGKSIKNEKDLNDFLYYGLSQKKNFYIQLSDKNFSSLINNNYFEENLNIEIEDLIKEIIPRIVLIRFNNFSQKALEVFQEIFNQFSTDGKMSKSQILKFINKGFNKNFEDYQMISDLFSSYLSNNEFLELEGLYKFYLNIIIDDNKLKNLLYIIFKKNLFEEQGLDIVWDNLYNFGYNNTLEKHKCDLDYIKMNPNHFEELNQTFKNYLEISNKTINKLCLGLYINQIFIQHLNKQEFFKNIKIMEFSIYHFHNFIELNIIFPKVKELSLYIDKNFEYKITGINKIFPSIITLNLYIYENIDLIGLFETVTSKIEDLKMIFSLNEKYNYSKLKSLIILDNVINLRIDIDKQYCFINELFKEIFFNLQFPNLKSYILNFNMNKYENNKRIGKKLNIDYNNINSFIIDILFKYQFSLQSFFSLPNKLENINFLHLNFYNFDFIFKKKEEEKYLFKFNINDENKFKEYYINFDLSIDNTEMQMYEKIDIKGLNTINNNLNEVEEIIENNGINLCDINLSIGVKKYFIKSYKDINSIYCENEIQKTYFNELINFNELENLKYINITIGHIKELYKDIYSSNNHSYKYFIEFIKNSHKLESLILRLESYNYKENINFILSLVEELKELKIVNISDSSSNFKYDISLDTLIGQFPNLNNRINYFKEFKINNIGFESSSKESIKINNNFLNRIICIYNIKEIDKQVQILNKFNEEGNIYNEYFQLYLNNQKIDFCFFYQFPQKGEYELKIKFMKTLTDMSYMFFKCSFLTSLDLSNIYTNNVQYMGNMFSNCSSLISLDLSNVNTNNVTDMNGMFSDCSSLISLDLSNFNTNNVTNMSNMFSSCSSLSSLDLSNFNTSNVDEMRGMFSRCSSLTSLDLSNFNTNNVIEMSYMFSECNSLTSLIINNFSNNKLLYLINMFSNCSSLISLDLTNFNTNNVQKMNGMFSGCSSLTSLDLSNFNTNNVNDMSFMFSGCSSLISLNLSNFKTYKVTKYANIFDSLKKDCKIISNDNKLLMIWEIFASYN